MFALVCSENAAWIMHTHCIACCPILGVTHIVYVLYSHGAVAACAAVANHHTVFWTRSWWCWSDEARTAGVRPGRTRGTTAGETKKFN